MTILSFLLLQAPANAGTMQLLLLGFMFILFVFSYKIYKKYRTASSQVSSEEINTSGSSKNSNQSALIILGFFLLAFMVTNPSIEDHRQAVLDKVLEKISKKSANSSQWQNIGEGFGVAIGQSMIEKSVSRKNIILFSITKITIGRVSKTIGFGILGNVWIGDVSNIE